MPTELMDKLIKMVKSVPELFGEPEVRRFDKFVAHYDTYSSFKSLSKSLTEEDLDSLNLDNADLLEDETYVLHKFVFDAIESAGMMPRASFQENSRHISGSLSRDIETLCSACILNDVSTCLELVQRIGANVVDRNFQTPLMYAIGNCHYEIAKALLSNNADPNLITPKLETAMHVCASTICSKEIFDMLILHGGKLDIPNFDEKTARSILVENQRVAWLGEQE